MGTVQISKSFQFSIQDIDTAPVSLLRKFCFVDEEVQDSGPDLRIWRLLIGSVARKMAFNSLGPNEQDVDEDFFLKMQNDAEQMDWSAQRELFSVHKSKWREQLRSKELRGEMPMLPPWYDEYGEKKRRCLKIELAMHQFGEWRSNSSKEMERRLRELAIIGLRAAEITSLNNGRHSEIPVVAPGSTFVAEFRMYNPGPTAWPPGCYGTSHRSPFKINASGDQITNVIPHAVLAGDEVVLRMRLRAPDLSSDVSRHQCEKISMQTPGGSAFGWDGSYEYALDEGSLSKVQRQASKLSKDEVADIFAKLGRGKS